MSRRDYEALAARLAAAESRANAAESELATAKARVAELEAEVAIAWDDDAETKRANAAESELADLRGRVERALAYTGQRREWAEIGPKMLEALRGR